MSTLPLSFFSCDSGRSSGRLVCRLPGDVAGVQDEEEGRGQLHAGGTQTGHRHLPETRQAGGVLRITLVCQRDAPHTEGERKSEREKRERYSKPPLWSSFSSSSSSSLPPSSARLSSSLSPLVSQTLESAFLSADMELSFQRKWKRGQKKQNKKNGKKQIQIYSKKKKITHTHKMFLK